MEVNKQKQDAFEHDHNSSEVPEDIYKTNEKLKI